MKAEILRTQVRPLPQAVMEARKTMPTTDWGDPKGEFIVDPRYLPHSRQADYLKRWGAWFRANPLYREPWMLELIAWGKRAQGR